MIELIVNWYKLYPSCSMFLFHKAVHIIVGLLITGFGCLTHYTIVGCIITLLVAIGKEIADHNSSYDVNSGSYQYDAPLSAHVFDVIVTCLGGAIALGLSMWLL